MNDMTDKILDDELGAAVDKARVRLQNAGKEASILAELARLRVDHDALVNQANAAKRRQLLAELAQLRGA